MNRFTNLEVLRAVLDLKDDVGLELSVERLEVVVAGAGAVDGGIAPVLLAVIDEAAPEQFLIKRLDRTGDDVGAFGLRTAIDKRAGEAFAVRLDDETDDVRDVCVEFGDLLMPPCFNSRGSPRRIGWNMPRRFPIAPGGWQL